MEQNKPAVAKVKIEVRPVNVGINYAMEELRREYAQIKGIYEAAIGEINARLQTLDSEFSFKYMHNPIHHMESRSTFRSPNRQLYSLSLALRNRFSTTLCPSKLFQ